MDNKNKIIIGVLGLAGLAFLASKVGATTQPPTEPPATEGTLDIISCPSNIDIGTSGSSVSVPVTVKAINGYVISKQLKIIAGNYTDIKTVTLNINETDTITFIIPNVTQNTQYTVNIV